MKLNKIKIVLLLLIILLIFTSACSFEKSKQNVNEQEKVEENTESKNPEIETPPITEGENSSNNENNPPSDTKNDSLNDNDNESSGENGEENGEESGGENDTTENEDNNENENANGDQSNNSGDENGSSVSEQAYLNFRESVSSNSSFIVTRQVGGQANYLLEVYYDGEKFYTITTTTAKTHKVYTSDYVYTNNLSKRVVATKSIQKLKEEFVGEIFETNWLFGKEINGENQNFNQCSMVIKSDKEIEFLFEKVENGKVVYFVSCNVELKENLNLYEIVPNALKSVV